MWWTDKGRIVCQCSDSYACVFSMCLMCMWWSVCCGQHLHILHQEVHTCPGKIVLRVFFFNLCSGWLVAVLLCRWRMAQPVDWLPSITKGTASCHTFSRCASGCHSFSPLLLLLSNLYYQIIPSFQSIVTSSPPSHLFSFPTCPPPFSSHLAF